MKTRFFCGIFQDRKTERGAEVLDNSAVIVKAREARRKVHMLFATEEPTHVSIGVVKRKRNRPVSYVCSLVRVFYLVLTDITALGSLKSVPNHFITILYQYLPFTCNMLHDFVVLLASTMNHCSV